MTDLEISKALALAIGWPQAQVCVYTYGVYILRYYAGSQWVDEFDYRDPVISFRVAERYDVYPYRTSFGIAGAASTWVSERAGIEYEAETPAKAIALAVIAGVKR